MKVFNQLGVFLAFSFGVLIFGGNCAAAATPYFGRAILVERSLSFASQVTVDCFDSSDPNASDNGAYSPALAQDTAVVAIASDNPLDIGNAKIAGFISTVSPSLTIGLSGSVGDRLWLDGGMTGVQAGHHLTTAPIYMPQVQSPFTNGLSPLVNGTITTTNGVEIYSFLFDSGDYVVDNLYGRVFVRGDARVLVRTNINITASGKIDVLEGASLVIYCAGESASIGGSGVINRTGRAIAFQYFGLPPNSELLIGGSPGMIGAVYAPNSYVSISGGGSVTSVFIGAIVSGTLRVSGRASFHYDKALGTSGPTWDYPNLLLSISKQGTNGTLRIAGPPDTSYTLQSKTSASGTNWHYFWSSNIDPAGFDEFPIWLNSSTRYFRTVHPQN